MSMFQESFFTRSVMNVIHISEHIFTKKLNIQSEYYTIYYFKWRRQQNAINKGPIKTAQTVF